MLHFQCVGSIFPTRAGSMFPTKVPEIFLQIALVGYFMIFEFRFVVEMWRKVSSAKLSCTLDKCRKISCTHPHWLHNKGKNCGQIFYCREKSSSTFVGIFPTHSMQSSKNSPQVKFIGALVANNASYTSPFFLFLLEHVRMKYNIINMCMHVFCI